MLPKNHTSMGFMGRVCNQQYCEDKKGIFWSRLPRGQQSEGSGMKDNLIVRLLAIPQNLLLLLLLSVTCPVMYSCNSIPEKKVVAKLSPSDFTSHFPLSLVVFLHDTLDSKSLSLLWFHFAKTILTSSAWCGKLSQRLCWQKLTSCAGCPGQNCIFAYIDLRRKQLESDVERKGCMLQQLDIQDTCMRSVISCLSMPLFIFKTFPHKLQMAAI